MRGLLASLLALLLPASAAAAPAAVVTRVRTVAPGSGAAASGARVPLGSSGRVSVAPRLGGSLALPPSLIRSAQTPSVTAPGAAAPAAALTAASSAELPPAARLAPAARRTPVEGVPAFSGVAVRDLSVAELGSAGPKDAASAARGTRRTAAAVDAAARAVKTARAPASALAGFAAGQALFDAARGRAGGALSATDAEPAEAAGAEFSGREAWPKAWPKLPHGLKGVSVETLRDAADVERVIPHNGNASKLITGLKRAVRAGPASALVYRDSLGRRFVGIDLGRDPSWVDRYPELDPHERDQIRLIQRRFRDVQVLAREEGKTPDLIVNGVVTELKADFGDFGIVRLVQKANRQIDEFTSRHMIAEGDLAIHLRQQTVVPADEVRRELNAWAAGTRHVALARVWVYAGDDMKVFRRGADGRFAQVDEAGATKRRGGLDRARVNKLQLLVKQGRLVEAQRLLGELERSYGALLRDYSPVAQARDQLAAERMLGRLRKLASRPGGKEQAESLWSEFRRSHSPEAVFAVSERAAAVLDEQRPRQKPMAWGADAESLALPELELAEPMAAHMFARELEEPARALRRKGVRAVVSVYGSARIKSPEEARRALLAAEARIGAEPENAQLRRAAAEARRDLLLSRHYEEARRFGALVARAGRGRVGVATGGGPGIMEAANRGAFEAGGPSIGYNIVLPHEQQPNPYQSEGLSFEFESFSTRKMNLRNGAVAHVFFAGGFGTMDEMFEILTLMQTGKIPRAPIVLFGKRDYWSQVLNFQAFEDMGLISRGDLDLFRFAETAEEGWTHIEAALAPKEPSAN